MLLGHGVVVMQRRRFIQVSAGLASAATIGAKPALARGRGGRGGGRPREGLVNAEVTETGAIVATDDGFVIADQTVVLDDDGYSERPDGAGAAISTGQYDGVVRDNTVMVDEVSRGELFGIRIEGGRVSVSGNTIEGADQLSHEFLGIGAVDGAHATIDGNTVNGRHRVGILATDAGTDATIVDNRVVGGGRTSTGWAENGIQVSGGATGAVVGNQVGDHWWDGDWMSSGIILFNPGDGVHLRDNVVTDSDAAIVPWGGDGHHVRGNTIEFTADGQGPAGTYNEGVWVANSAGTRVVQNDLSAVDGVVGLYLTETATDTKLIGNRIDGFEVPILDDGDETILPAPFDPSR